MRRALLALVLLAASTASAFTVGTAFSVPCHERLTAPLAAVVARNGGVTGGETDDAVLAALAQALAPAWGVSRGGAAEDVALVSLVLGVRAPDTFSHSLLALSHARDIHLDPATQDAHALRGPGDDGPAGDASALAAARALVRRKLEEAERHRGERLAVRLDVDFYGAVEVRVERGAFHLGEALHALQDSFSHGLRTADFRRVQHVLTYVDAMTPAYDEARDGLRHASGLDACEEGAREAARAAGQASAEVVEAFLAGGVEAGAAAADGWLASESGCTVDNDYCGNPQVPLARASGARPLLGCEASPAGLASPLLFVAWALLKGRRRTPAPASVPRRPARREPPAGGTWPPRRSRCARPTDG